MLLKNNTFLITGGSSGIGLELSRSLCKNNKVLICGRDKSKLDAAKQLLPEIDYFECDVSREEDCLKLLEWVSLNFKQCNILINNAAIVHSFNFFEDKQAITLAEAEFKTNTIAPIRLCSLFYPLLISNTNPGIINISTGLVYTPRAIYPFYNATKAALHSFTQVLRCQNTSALKITEILLPAVKTQWHKGNPPKIAIPTEDAVNQIIKKLKKGENTEIRIGAVNLLYWLSRMAPDFAFKKINSL